MKPVPRRAVLAAVLPAFAAARMALAQPAPQPGIVVNDVWARPSPAGATTGAAYFTITDTAGADRLVGVATPIAETTELHETINDNGVMKMRPVAGLALETGKPVTLAPGGHHVMMTGLKRALKAGESFPLTLTFEKSPPMTVQVRVAVRVASSGMPAMAGQGMAGMDHRHGAKP